MTWQPPSVLEERIKYTLVPGPLYIRYRVWKELHRGEQELKLLPFLVDPARDAIDVGANKGVWTHLLARRARRVHAFEPNPKLFGVLRRGLAANAEAHPVAAADRDGEAELRIPRGPKGYSNQRASLSPAQAGDSYGSVTVPVRRLDSYGFRDIGFIKIDVEGYEAEVIAGAAELIARERPVLVVEMEEIHTRRPIEEMIAGVERLGYTGYALKRGVLTATALIDMQRHHRQPAERADYVFNFIFLPALPPAGA